MKTNLLKLIAITFFIIAAPIVTIGARTSWENIEVNNSTTAQMPDMDYGAGKYGLVHYDNKSGNGEIYLDLLDVKGNKVFNEINVSQTPNNSYDPDVVWNGESFGIFWYDLPNGIHYSRVSKEGVVLASTKIADTGVSVSAVWNRRAKEYGVTWWADNADPLKNGAHFARIDIDGNKLSPITPLSNAVTGGYYLPHVETDGSEYGVVWHDNRTCGATYNCFEIIYARVDANGEKVGSETQLTNTGYELLNDMVWNGNNYAYVTYGNTGTALLEADAAGNVIQFTALNGNPPYNNNMGLAWRRDHYVLSTIGNIGGNVDILVADYDRYGNILGEFTTISSSPSPDYYPTAPVVNGNSVAVAWVRDIWEATQGISFTKK